MDNRHLDVIEVAIENMKINCPTDMVTFSGGNTKFPGFEKRLYQELSELFEDKTNIKVRSLPNRELLGWIGGARYSARAQADWYEPNSSFVGLSCADQLLQTL